jgi:hypothetical protein
MALAYQPIVSSIVATLLLHNLYCCYIERTLLDKEKEVLSTVGSCCLFLATTALLFGCLGLPPGLFLESDLDRGGLREECYAGT